MDYFNLFPRESWVEMANFRHVPSDGLPCHKCWTEGLEDLQTRHEFLVVWKL